MLFDRLTEDQRALSDSEIVPIAQAITAAAIPNAPLKTFLRENGLVVSDSINGGRRGAIINASFPDAVKLSVDALLTAVYDEGVPVQTNLTEKYSIVAGPVKQTVAALVAAGAMTSEQVEAFYSLAGGLLYSSIDQAGVAAERATFDAEIARDALRETDLLAYSDLEAVRNAPSTTKADLIAAYESAADYIRDNA